MTASVQFFGGGIGSDIQSLNPQQRVDDDGAVVIGEVLGHWRSIGSARGLLSDADIARFLVRCYEAGWPGQEGGACCMRCHAPLTLCCLTCSPLSPPPPPLPYTTTTTVSIITTTSQTLSSSPVPADISVCVDEDGSKQDDSSHGTPEHGAGKDHPCARHEDTGDKKTIKTVSGLAGYVKSKTFVDENVERNEHDREDDGNRNIEGNEDDREDDGNRNVERNEDDREDDGNRNVEGNEDDGEGDGNRNVERNEDDGEDDGNRDVERNEHDGEGDGNGDGYDIEDDGSIRELIVGQDEHDVKGNSACEIHSDSKSSRFEELRCVLCCEPFTEPDPLTLHMQTHSADMVHRCDVCRASFLLAGVLEQHKSTHTGRQQNSRSSQQKHQNRNIESTGKFVVANHITNTEKLKHSQNKTFLTRLLKEQNAASENVCGDSESQEQDLNMYDGDTDIESENESGVNSMCRQRTKTTSSVIVHQSRDNTTLTGDGKSKQFLQGGNTYEQKQTIQQSRQVYNSDKSDQMSKKPTPVCIESQQNHMSKHLTLTHNNTQQDQTILEPITERLRSREKRDMFGCQHCGQSCTSLNRLLVHARTHYLNMVSQTCTVCERTFSSASSMKRHRCRSIKVKEVDSNHHGDEPVVKGKDDKADGNVAVVSTDNSVQLFSLCTSAELSEFEQKCASKTTRNSRGTSSEKLASDMTAAEHKCDVCAVVCGTSEELQRHKLASHKTEHKFQCGQCGKILCNMQTLVTHQRTHTGAKPYQCPNCPSTFRSSSNLRAHLRTHTGHTPYLCPQCGRGFKEITHLKRHLVSHSGEKPHQCQECGKAYVHATSLKEHQLTHSPNPKSWVCHQCGKAFINSKKLNVHLKTHTDKGEGRPPTTTTNGKRYSCPTCGVTYQQASSLSRHKKLHEVGTSPHACSECGKTFRDKYELKKHSSVHSGLAPYPCKLCPKSFRNSFSFKRHLLSHSGVKPHACPLCRKGYADAKALKQHLQVHAGFKPHTCPQCSKTFFTSWTLRLHLQCHADDSDSSKSPRGKSHVCHQCGVSYLRASSLVRHQRLHDVSKERSPRYQCKQCHRLFGDSSHLKRHLLSHSGEKPFVCASCGKAYADSHTLKDHMQTHTGVRSFICEVCGKAFFNTKTLKEHARSHSDQRPFQCSECSASYKHLSGLISHRRVHSGVRPFSCGECSKTFKDYTCYKRHQLTHSPHKPHVCQQCGKAYKDLKNLRHHQAQLHGNTA